MRHATTVVILASCLTVAASAADLHQIIQGEWVVDEKARLEASPMYSLSSPARQKELEASLAKVPATRFEFTATTLRVVGADPVAYKIVKRTANSLVLETTASTDGLMPRDEITIGYVSDASLEMTTKSAGIKLVLNRAK